ITTLKYLGSVSYNYQDSLSIFIQNIIKLVYSNNTSGLQNLLTNPDNTTYLGEALIGAIYIQHDKEDTPTSNYLYYDAAKNLQPQFNTLFGTEDITIDQTYGFLQVLSFLLLDNTKAEQAYSYVKPLIDEDKTDEIDPDTLIGYTDVQKFTNLYSLLSSHQIEAIIGRLKAKAPAPNLENIAITTTKDLPDMKVYELYESCSNYTKNLNYSWLTLDNLVIMDSNENALSGPNDLPNGSTVIVKANLKSIGHTVTDNFNASINSTNLDSKEITYYSDCTAIDLTWKLTISKGFTITFNNNGHGDEISPLLYVKINTPLKDITLPTPSDVEEDGHKYTFKEWVTANGGSIQDVTLTDDITLLAVWEESEITSPEPTTDTAETAPASNEPENTEASETAPASNEPVSTEATDITPASNGPVSTEATDITPASNEPVSTEATDITPASNEPKSTDSSENTPASNEPVNTEAADITPTSSDSPSGETESASPTSNVNVTSSPDAWAEESSEPKDSDKPEESKKPDNTKAPAESTAPSESPSGYLPNSGTYSYTTTGSAAGNTTGKTATPAAANAVTDVGSIIELSNCNLKFRILTMPSTDVYGTVACAGMINPTVENVDIPDEFSFEAKLFKVTEIDDNAFLKNAYIQNVYFSSYLTKIGNKSFKGCTGISKITIPNKVTSIGKKAFANCGNLKKITIKTKKLKKSTIGKNCFQKIHKKAKIKVPGKKKKAYKKAFKKAGLPKKAKIK
ncbi:MAG: leucine-rich repeat protein, partial [Lachnospiraceae bacterium]|nr:leucine-rich repeat protein [Lachnospiraceae bacterium]